MSTKNTIGNTLQDFGLNDKELQNRTIKFVWLEWSNDVLNQTSIRDPRNPNI